VSRPQPSGRDNEFTVGRKATQDLCQMIHFVAYAYRFYDLETDSRESPRNVRGVRVDPEALSQLRAYGDDRGSWCLRHGAP